MTQNQRRIGLLVTVCVFGGLFAPAPKSTGQTAPSGKSEAQYIFNVRNYGAMGDGRQVDTQAIQNAIKACANAGGGEVVFPPGIYVSGTLELLSHVTLDLYPGAVLQESTNLADYSSFQDLGGFHVTEGRNTISGESTKWAGLIVAKDASDVSIVGRGTIDGQGDAFMDMNKMHVGLDFDPSTTRQGKAFLDALYQSQDGPVEVKMNGRGRPGSLIVFWKCKNILLRDVTIKDAPNWTVHFQNCDGVVMESIRILNNLLIPNNDGVHSVESRNVHFSNCDIVSGDDALAIFRNENVTASDCSLTSRSSAIRLGGTRFAVFHHLDIHANRGLAIYQSLRPDQGTENVIFSDINIETKLVGGHWWGKAEPILIGAGPGAEPTSTGAELGTDSTQSLGVRNVIFSNIIATGEGEILIYGSQRNVIRNVLLENVDFRLHAGPPAIMDAEGGNFDLRSVEPNLSRRVVRHDIPALYCQYADGLQIRNFNLSWGDDLPPYFTNAIECNHFKNLTIDGFDGRQARIGGEEPDVNLEDGEGVSVLNSIAAPGTGTFLSVTRVTNEHLFANNDVRDAQQPMQPSRTGFKLSGNIFPESARQPLSSSQKAKQNTTSTGHK